MSTIFLQLLVMEELPDDERAKLAKVQKEIQDKNKE